MDLLPQNSFNSDKKLIEEKVLFRNCNLHKEDHCDFIDLTLTAPNARICL